MFDKFQLLHADYFQNKQLSNDFGNKQFWSRKKTYLMYVGLKIIHDGDARTFVRTRIRLLPDMRWGVMQTSRGKQNILAGAELGLF